MWRLSGWSILKSSTTNSDSLPAAEHHRQKRSTWPAQVVTLSPEEDQPSTTQGLVQLILERARSAVRNKERCITIARWGTRPDCLLVPHESKLYGEACLHAQLGPAWSAVRCVQATSLLAARLHTAAYETAVDSPGNWVDAFCVTSALLELHAATAWCDHAVQ